MVRATPSTSGADRLHSTSRAPSRAKRSATAWPIPRLAPVTIATTPESFIPSPAAHGGIERLRQEAAVATPSLHRRPPQDRSKVSCRPAPPPRGGGGEAPL